MVVRFATATPACFTRAAFRKSQQDVPVEWAGAVHPARDSGWVSWYPGDTKGLAELTKKNYAKGIECPYGRVGNRLWCRETWRTFERPEDGVDGILFRADNHFQPIESTRAAADQWLIAHDNGKHGDEWRPSIFMRRWMSRITLEITEVRVERLNQISVYDALKEGIKSATKDGRLTKYGLDSIEWYHWRQSPIDTFAYLWDQINGKKAPWDSNPWVWAITFKRIEASVQKEAA
jgi:hypothetical protein